MNNENNVNGTVLGSVDNNATPNQVPTSGVENLGPIFNNANEPVNLGVSNDVGLQMPTPEPITPEPVPPVAEQPVQPAPISPEPVPEPINVMPNQNLGQDVNLGVNPEPLPPQDLANVQSEVPPVMPTADQPFGPQPVMENSNPIPPVTPTPVEPMPAYTNPQTINPNPTGYENPNAIGTNPPMTFEKEKSPKKNNRNKLLFIIIIIVVLFGVGFGTYYVLNYTNLLNNNKTVIDIKTKNLEINLGEDVPNNISDLAVITGTQITNCSYDVSKVDTTKAGVYEYTVSCGNLSNTGKITVVAKEELNIKLNDVYKAKGETLEASEFAKDNNEVKLEFVDNSAVEEYLTSTPGVYQVKLKATVDNDTKEVEGNLVMLEYPLKGFYTCTGKEGTVSDSNAKMTVGDMFTIINGGDVLNGYGKVAYEIHIFNYQNATSEFTELVNKYNNEGTLTINNITGDVTIDEENKTITIKNALKNEDVIQKYGEDNLKDYTTIKDYYTKLNSSQTDETYSCKYEKSN